MSIHKTVRQRAISLVLAFVMGVCGTFNTAMAQSSSSTDYVDSQNGNSIQRVYDSGNVVLTNRVQTVKNNIVKVSLKVKVKSINDLLAQHNDFSEEETEKDSNVPLQSLVDNKCRSFKALLDEEKRNLREEDSYEIRYYIDPGFEVVESALPKNAAIEEDGAYVSWPGLTVKQISSFSVNLKLKPCEDKDSEEKEEACEASELSGVYKDDALLFSFAENKTVLSPITSKEVLLNDWDERTYDVNLSVTAQSHIITSSQPCDIILVLDRSGSMAQKMKTYAPITGEPDRDNSYYILRNGEYEEVNYKESSLVFWHSSGWYYWDDGYVRVYPSAGGTGSGGNYQFYTLAKQSKMNALKEAAINFVDTVESNSPDSRIGVVSFASDWRMDTRIQKNGKQKSLLRVGNSDSKDEIVRAVASLKANGATAADGGMWAAKDLFTDENLYEDVDSKTPRSRAVIFFTDGEPNHGSGYQESVAQAAINAAKVLKDEYKATVYSVGVFSGLKGKDLKRVETFMKAVASKKPNSEDKEYYPVSATSSINDIFQTISTEMGGFTGAKITDVIDPRFELTPDEVAELKNDGANVTNNSNGMQTVTWSNQEIKAKTTWQKSFTIQAKEEFIGGNAIPTNVPESSGVFYGTNEFASFGKNSPTVNVKPNFYLSNADTTIFLGEEVPDCKFEPFTVFAEDGKPVADQDIYCGASKTGSFTYNWLDADGNTSIGNVQSFPTGQIPEEDTKYTLKTVFHPNAPTDASTANSGNHVAGVTENNIEQENAKGIYSVHVVKGGLTIHKTIVDTKGKTITSADPRQFFTFKIERYADDSNFSGTPLSTTYEVLYTENGVGSKTITNLPHGKYKVTEISNSAWRYAQQNAVVYGKGQYVGRDSNNAKAFIGTQDDPITAEIQNTLKNDKWISGKDSVTNVFKQLD